MEGTPAASPPGSPDASRAGPGGSALVQARSGSRRFVFTCNNYVLSPEGEEPALYPLIRDERRIKFFICGRELAPSTGTPHLQGYFEVSKAVLISVLQKWTCFDGQGCAILVAKGTAEQNRVYCSKGGNSVSYGEPISVSKSGQGARTDWAQMRDMIRTKATDEAIADELPHLLYPHVTKLPVWRGMHDKMTRTWKTIPKIFFGPTRAGKSFTMRLEAEALAASEGWRIFTKSDSSKWWDGYSGEEIILIDEMDGSFFSWKALLRFFETGSYRVEFKGGSVEFLGRIVFMTTNDHPECWYKNHPWDDSNAFRARIEEFGELRIFSGRTRDMNGDYVYNPGRKDLTLDAPPPDPIILAQLDENRRFF